MRACRKSESSHPRRCIAARISVARFPGTVLRNRGAFTTGIALALLAASTAGPTSNPAAEGDWEASTGWVERGRYLMGTVCVARAQGEPVRVGDALDAALDRIARLDDAMTTYREDGGLARLNRALATSPPGTPVAVEPLLFSALDRALGWARETGGRFDPTVGALGAAWGLKASGRSPGAGEVESAVAATSWRLVQLHRESRSVSVRRAGVSLDLGGFGKGYALDAAAEELLARGVRSALINFGGQVMALGAPVGAAGWIVDVADPRERSRPAVRLLLRDAHVATSGNSERYVVLDGRRYGHLIDPSSGRPLERSGSMTVVADEGTAADVLATALMVAGPEQGRSWLPATADYLSLRPGQDGALFADAGLSLRRRLTPIENVVWTRGTTRAASAKPTKENR